MAYELLIRFYRNKLSWPVDLPDGGNPARLTKAGGREVIVEWPSA